MTWHVRDPARWKAEQQIGRQILDDFRSGVDKSGVPFLEGVFHVRSEHGHRYESVTLRIEYPPTFPNRGTTPKVILLSHRDRWKKSADSHINGDWSLCLYVPVESGIDFRRADSLNALFGVLRTFLFKEHLYQQALVDELFTGVKAVWPGEARSHGTTGIAEAVQDIGRVGRNQPCPCGSGRKFKNCCLARLRR
jgi:hypothetical protein